MAHIAELAEKFPDITISVKASELAMFGREIAARVLADAKRLAEDRILSVAEAAQMLGKSERTIYRMGERGKINVFKLEGVNAVKLSDINKYIEEYSSPI